eukprot:CAMPEP_0176368348 /NCGR_PEP_ID=MMETSP0126-20121128/22527_1 /TAXON_ID=141414 ORGANISM="Strombidinopsis acuminatum, Strain SPMC142" /NCGR_SAMPLE_ID=MMETSP0126 /ASSEMBLY_ACC=CAM_ASM_000229 /LENGTH=50 /DNA_ID=CAMNT_0017726553 /DNA_START=590 /DNA_END=742 /DNA_ORIENTATION=-
MEQVGFDAFYDQLQKWAVTQETLDPIDFIGKEDDNVAQTNQINAFRNMAK